MGGSAGYHNHSYELIVFHFSVHTLRKDGILTYETEWINAETGVFPNYEFVR